MKKNKLLVLLFTALSIVSCGEKSKSNDSYEVTVDNTTIGGKLSNYFSLVDKTYKYEKGIIDKVNVELECKEPLPDNLKAYIAVEVLDDGGSVISASKADAWSFDDSDVLRQATPGQIVTIKIQNHDNIGDETPAKIRLSSIIEEEDNKNESTSKNEESSSDQLSSGTDDDESSEAENDVVTSGSEDWDALLVSYEQYVNKYISLMKKAANGDMNALSEYPSFMEKAEELSNKMENAQGEMSPSQWARYNKITMKMMQAAQN